jgi:hypothetical protein
MNWSAFFQGAPAGFSQGMDWTQRFNQNQQMNPLLVQHQQLQNQQLGQNIGQSGTSFGREGNMYDAMMRAYGVNGAQGGQISQSGGLGMPAPGQGQGQHSPYIAGQPFQGGQPPQGTTPTATPQNAYQGPGNNFADIAKARSAVDAFSGQGGQPNSPGAPSSPFSPGNVMGGMNLYQTPQSGSNYMATPTYPGYPGAVPGIYGGGAPWQNRGGMM